MLVAHQPRHKPWLRATVPVAAAHSSLAAALVGAQVDPAAPISTGDMSTSDFFIVRALRCTGVGRAAAGQVLAFGPGPWSIGCQSYNPGFQRFWWQVASDAVGDTWATHDDPPIEGRPPDSWITLTICTGPGPDRGRLEGC